MDIVYLNMPAEQILHTALYNKGSAFTEEERTELGFMACFLIMFLL